MLNPNLAAKISYERILNNFQNEAVNRSGVFNSHSFRARIYKLNVFVSLNYFPLKIPSQKEFTLFGGCEREGKRKCAANIQICNVDLSVKG